MTKPENEVRENEVFLNFVTAKLVRTELRRKNKLFRLMCYTLVGRRRPGNDCASQNRVFHFAFHEGRFLLEHDES